MTDASNTRKAIIKYPWLRDDPAENPNQPPVIYILEGLSLNTRNERTEKMVTMDSEMKILTSNHVFRILRIIEFMLLNI